MALFQKPIIDKYLAKQDKKVLATQWHIYRNHFHNPDVQENIRNSKEEQYQEGFLRDLFVKILGYTLNPDQNFNLTTELKNVKDSKKADGAMIFDQKVITIIELKGTNTTDLNRIEVQAFGYKNNQPECVYVITSNFEKLRFYIDNAIENIEFNLFKLTEKEFEILYLCLCCENVKNGLPKLLKQESLNQEDAITKKLYQDYSNFKNDLYQNLLKNNPQFAPLELFKKSQKLLDRFLFLFFAEDKLLVQPNSVRIILKKWRSMNDWDDYLPLYEQYKKYFNFFNKGIKNQTLEIYPYNGGLFLADEFLDQLKIDDHILEFHTLKMSDYDFNSEVDVNILGHIFENSLNEIDEIRNSTSSKSGISESVSKRKKDGVFYTPKYITKYIVENTVGKLCTAKKTELQILDNEYVKDKKRKKDQTQILLDKLKTYRNWLLQITIIDPACGSGAFLNEALNFLIAEHAYIDELQAKLFGDSLILSDVEKSILENNLFGVDINEESVDIAKLSLWLRTARPERKLNNLNANIKCGNSLISDSQVAGNQAFDWEKEFPQVFEKGGFDVVIGNPPYVRGRELEENERRYLDKYGISSNDTAILFIKKSFELVKNQGFVSYIVPKSLLYASNWDTIRDEIYDHLYLLIDCGKVWNEVLLEQVIFGYTKEKRENYLSGYRSNSEIVELDMISNHFASIFKFLPAKETSKSLNLALKIQKNGVSLNSVYNNVAGVPFQKYIEENGDFNMIGGAEFNRIEIKGIKGKIAKKWVQSENALIKENTVIVQNIIAHIMYPAEHIKITACIPSQEHIGKTSLANTVNQLILKDGFDISNKYTWCLLNSKLINWYVYRFVFALAVRTMHFYNPITEKVPFKTCENQQIFIEKADLMLELNKNLQEISQKFQRTLQRKFDVESLPNKLQSWYLLSYKDFIKELEKKKVKLTLSQESEWEEYFASECKKANEISAQILQTDQEIDRLVYELYNLNQEEIEMIEKM